jgi:hypothetical protein
MKGDSEFVGLAAGDDDAEVVASRRPSLKQGPDPVSCEPDDVGDNVSREEINASPRASFNLSAEQEAALVSETELVSFGAPFTPLPERQQAKLRYNQLQAEVQRRKAEQRD